MGLEGEGAVDVLFVEGRGGEGRRGRRVEVVCGGAVLGVRAEKMAGGRDEMRREGCWLVGRFSFVSHFVVLNGIESLHIGLSHFFACKVFLGAICEHWLHRSAQWQTGRILAALENR